MFLRARATSGHDVRERIKFAVRRSGRTRHEKNFAREKFCPKNPHQTVRSPENLVAACPGVRESGGQESGLSVRGPRFSYCAHLYRRTCLPCSWANRAPAAVAPV